MLTGTLAKSGKYDESLTLLLKCIYLVEQSGKQWCLAEMHRLHGELLLNRGAKPTRIEDSYLRAIELAWEQRARSIELRATTELCQLWGKQGKIGKARKMLSAIYTWYTEGLERAELQKAKTVLDSLTT